MSDEFDWQDILSETSESPKEQAGGHEVVDALIDILKDMGIKDTKQSFLNALTEVSGTLQSSLIGALINALLRKDPEFAEILVKEFQSNMAAAFESFESVINKTGEDFKEEKAFFDPETRKTAADKLEEVVVGVKEKFWELAKKIENDIREGTVDFNDLNDLPRAVLNADMLKATIDATRRSLSPENRILYGDTDYSGLPKTELSKEAYGPVLELRADSHYGENGEAQIEEPNIYPAHAFINEVLLEGNFDDAVDSWIKGLGDDK